jgi:hypothetical protein
MQSGLFTQLLIIPHPGISAESPLLRLRPDHWNVSFLTPGDAYDVNLHEMGTTPDQPAVRVSVQAPLGRKGYAYQLFGTYERLESPPEAFRFQLVGPVGFSELQGPILDGATLIAWRRRVLCEGTSISVEAYWCPAARETRMQIDGPAKAMRPKIMKQVQRAMTLLEAIEGPGRPPGSKEISEAEFRQTYPETYQQILDAYGSKPRRKEMAMALGIDRKTFRSYLKEYNLPFPPF